MKVNDQSGTINVLLVPVILLSLFFIGSAVFAYWAFNSRQDYKNNVDEKIAAAQLVTKKETQNADAKTYAEQAKSPLTSYNGPSAYGTVVAKYPKTWSAYVVTSTGDPALDAYFNPGYVPNTSDQTNTYALRVQVTTSTYDSVVQQFASQVKSGTVTLGAYSLPKVPGVVGSIVKGQLTTSKQGTMVILPLRNMTLKIWNESGGTAADFTNYVLPNFTFAP